MITVLTRTGEPRRFSEIDPAAPFYVDDQYWLRTSTRKAVQLRLVHEGRYEIVLGTGRTFRAAQGVEFVRIDQHRVQ